MDTNATKQDITVLRGELKQDITVLRSELKQDSAELRSELKQDIADLRSELKDSFADITSLLQIFMQQVDDRFTIIESEQKKTRKEISKIFTYLDGLSKRQEISDDERLVMGRQLDRLDKWTHELAAKIGHDLKI